MRQNVEIFEDDLRKWIAALAASGWMSVNLIEEAIQDKTLCFPLAKIELNKQGRLRKPFLANKKLNFFFKNPRGKSLKATQMPGADL